MYVRVLRLTVLALLTLCYAACAKTPPETSLNQSMATAVATDSPTPAAVVSDTPTVEAPPTDTPVPPTATATQTPLPPTASPTRTRTPVPTRTPTRKPSATATATSSATVQPAPVPAGGIDMNADEQKMLALINQERVKAGLNTLNSDLTFQSVAHARAMEMARTAAYSHYDTAGNLIARQMLQKLGVNVPMGENFYGWFMSDPPHHDNILSPRWTVAGVGVVTTSDQKGIAIQVFGMK